MNNSLTFHILLEHAWKHSRFYRELYRHNGIHEKDLPHLRVQDLPMVSKEAVMENFDEVVTDSRLRKKELLHWLIEDTDPHKKYLDEFTAMYSSGGSATNGIVAYDQRAWKTMTTVAAPHLWPADMDTSSGVRSAFYYARKAHFASTTVASQITSRSIQPLILTMADPLEDVLAQMAAFKPERLSSYASGAAFLAGLTLEGKLPIRPAEVVISGDRLTTGMEGLIHAAWGAKIFDLYAAVEALYLAIKPPAARLWTVFDELNILEILDDDDHPVPAGSSGRAVLTNLINLSMPFIRYELTDHLVPGDPLADGHPTLQAILGKTFDALTLPGDDGLPVKLSANELADFHVDGIDLIQFAPHPPQDLVIEYTGSSDIDQAVRKAFSEFLAGKGAGRAAFQVKWVDHIWNSKQGSKLKLIRTPQDVAIVLQPAVQGSTLSDILPPGEAAPRPMNAFIPFPAQLVESSIAHCFELQAGRSPNSVALTDGLVTFTYAQLNGLSNRVAHTLHDRTNGNPPSSALLFGHKATLVIAMLGVLKAGGMTIPLDPTSPEKRNAAILEDAQARFILTDSEGLATARACAQRLEIAPSILNMDELDLKVREDNLDLPILPHSPSFLLYTSGSTGKPRGVLLDQRAILHRVKLYTNDFHICPHDRLSLIEPYTTSASTRDIFGALLNGASLNLYDLRKKGLPGLGNWLIEQRLTMFYCVPSIFRVFLESLNSSLNGSYDREDFKHLRLIRLGGEPALVGDVEGFQQHFRPGTLLVNALASTETETICQFFIDHATRITGNSVPVGYPVSDTNIRVLDENGLSVGDGVLGEIVAVSAYMGPGYWSPAIQGSPLPGPAQTPATHAHPTGDLGFRLPDGRITLTGRKDWMVKINGQRINPGEIELQLTSLGNISQAVVTGFTRLDGGTHLAAYIVPKVQPAPTVESIRSELGTSLPASMLPAVYIFLDSLPLTPGGKVDRSRLPHPDQNPARTGPQKEPAGTSTEGALTAIFQEILGVQGVGSDDPFFQLGGDSLQAASLMLEIEKQFGQRLPPGTLVQHDSVRKLAALLSQAAPPQSERNPVLLQPLGAKPPLFLIPGLGTGLLSFRDLIVQLGTEHPVFGLEDGGMQNAAHELATVEKRAETCIHALKAAAPHGPYHLCGHSFGGLIALEMGRQLLEQGEKVPFVILLDSMPPGPKHNASLPKRLSIHWQNLQSSESPGEWFGYLAGRFKRLLLGSLRFRIPRWLMARTHLPLANKNTASRVAVAMYTPAPYPGKVVLFKVHERPEYVTWDPTAGWEDLIQGELEIRELGGNHTNVLKEPHVRELARQLRQILEAE